MQIAQFVIDLGLVYFGSTWRVYSFEYGSPVPFSIAYSHMAASYLPTLPHPGNCAGSESAAIFGCALLTSYLGLFINFYFQTYKQPATRKPTSNGVANGKANGVA